MLINTAYLMIVFCIVVLFIEKKKEKKRTKLKKSLKGILNRCKLQIVFKSQNKLAKAFHFKDRIS